jgi:beta-lactamase class A
LSLRSSLRSAIPVALIVAGLVSASLPVSMPVVSRPAEAVVRLPSEAGDAASAPPISETIARELDLLVERAPGRVSVVIASPAGEWTIERDAERTVRAASVIKLPILAAMLAVMEREAASLDETLPLTPGDYTGGSGSLRREHPRRALTLRELAERMIIESDNTATNALLRRFGLVALNDEFLKMGFATTRLERRILDGRGDNPTSAKEMAGLLQAIAASTQSSVRTAAGPGEPAIGGAAIRTGLNRESLAWMRSLLAKASNRRRLGRYLPPGVSLEHKTGTLRDLCHDVGIVHGENDMVIVAALIEDAAPGEAERWLGELGRVAFTGSRGGERGGTGTRIATANTDESWYSR